VREPAERRPAAGRQCHPPDLLLVDSLVLSPVVVAVFFFFFVVSPPGHGPACVCGRHLAASGASGARASIFVLALGMLGLFSLFGAFAEAGLLRRPCRFSGFTAPGLYSLFAAPHLRPRLPSWFAARWQGLDWRVAKANLSFLPGFIAA